MTIDITTNTLIGVLALCFTMCWISIAGRMHRHRTEKDMKPPGTPGET